MLPIGDDNRFRKITPYITYLLIILNVILFLIELNFGDEFIEQWAFVPNRFLSDPNSDFLTLFTSMFMHAGLLHIGSNMLYLWIFGDNIEDNFGHVKFLIFYLLCGLAATGAHLLVSIDSIIPTLGASGAISGALGAYIVLFPKKKFM